MSEHPTVQKRRLRLLYSLKDIELALSAANFLTDCDPESKIDKIMLRRYKCYETTAIISYARPFSESRGGVPKLSLKMIGIKLDDDSKALHDHLIHLRNMVVAHSDSEMMRMVSTVHYFDIRDDEKTPFVFPIFDEGLEFVGFSSVQKIMNLFHLVYHGIYNTIFEDARKNPDKFDFTHDYIKRDQGH